MTGKEIAYSIFYFLFFVLSVWAGALSNYTSSHTPPPAFIIKFFTLTIGIILFLIDFVRYKPVTAKKVRIHIVGLGINGALMFLVILPAL